MSRIISSARTSFTSRTSACAVEANSLATTTSRRQRDRRAAGARLVHEASCDVQHVILAQRLADVHPGGREERIGDAAADDQLVDALEQRLEHHELGGDLGAADDRHQRPRRLLQRALECLEFSHQQRARAGNRRKARHAVRARLGAMRGAEGVHHEHLAQRRHAARELLVVLLLALVEAHVLAQHRAAGRAVDPVEPVLAQRHGLAEQVRQARRHRRQRQCRIIDTLLGTAEVREDEDLGVLIERIADRGQRGADARIAA